MVDSIDQNKCSTMKSTTNDAMELSKLHKESGFPESAPSGGNDDLNYRRRKRCCLCRGYDFSKSRFDPKTMIVCDQCEKEYHIGCLKKHEMANLKEWLEGEWFCSADCASINSILQNFVSHGEEKVPSSPDVQWRILSGKSASSSKTTKPLLSKIVAIFHDYFDPIVDEATGQDFIPSMVYGQHYMGQELGGMYCTFLTINSTIVSVGILRVLGQEIAELPLVATHNAHQGKGYFKILFSCIEKLLSYFGVKKLFLPAATDAISMWVDKFNFERISPDQLSEYSDKCLPLLTFEGTTMLHKSIR